MGLRAKIKEYVDGLSLNPLEPRPRKGDVASSEIEIFHTPIPVKRNRHNVRLELGRSDEDQKLHCFNCLSAIGKQGKGRLPR